MDEYEVEIAGITHTLQLSDADAKARGLKAPEKTKAASKPANKAAAAPADKAE